MEGGMVIVVLLVKWFLAMLLVGWIPALIARNKGRRFLRWWIYGGGFFLIALIHALLIKPKKLETTEWKPVDFSRSEAPVKRKSTWKCECGEINLSVADECRQCHSQRPDL